MRLGCAAMDPDVVASLRMCLVSISATMRMCCPWGVALWVKPLLVMFALVARVMVLMMWSLGMATMKRARGVCCLVIAQVPSRSEGCWALQ